MAPNQNTENNNAEKMRRPFTSFFKKAVAYYRSHNNSYMIWTFALPFLLMMAIYMGMSAFPFGNRTVLTLDLNGQYVYFFEALRDWVYGEGSLIYSFSRSLGGEFMGIYAYYLASPLSYIVALFPKRMMPEAIFLILLIKCGLSGLSFGYFLKKTSSSGKAQTVIFSVLYAMSGYAIIMQHNTMWIDCVILLPMVALGIRELIRERKYKLFTISLALSILSNYYIGYMMCLFVLVYFFCCYFSMTPEERNPRRIKFSLVRSTAFIAIFSLIAIGLAMIIILPAYYSLSFGKNDFSSPEFNFGSKFELFDMMIKMFFGSYDTVRPSGLPILYCGTIVLFLLPIFFASSKIPVRHKGCAAAMILILTMSFNINTLNLVWHGLQNPNWLNYRESFMLVFIMLVASNEAFTHLREVSVRGICGIGIVLSLILVLTQHFDYEYLNFWYSIIAVMAIIGIYMLCVCLAAKVKNHSFEYASTMLAILICFEAFGGGMLNLGELFMDVGYAYRSGYIDYFDAWQGAIDHIKENDDGFYRMEKTNTRKVNDPYALGYYGLSGSTSTLNADTIEFLYHMGISADSHWSEFVRSGNPATNSLLGIKYLVTDDDDHMEDLYQYYYDDDVVSAYENPYAAAIAFGSSEDIRQLTFSEYEYDESNRLIEDGRTHVYSLSPMTKLNALYSAILGEESEIFTGTPFTSLTYTGATQSLISGHRKLEKRDPSKDAIITITLDVDRDGAVYFFVPTEYKREVLMRVNDDDFGKYFTNSSHAAIYLGEYLEGDRITVTLNMQEDNLYIGTGINYFYYFNEDVFTYAAKKICDSSINIFEHSPTYFSGEITLDEQSTTVLTTIPYDKEWGVKVDGQKVETFECVDALLAFEAGEGTHSIERHMNQNA